MVKGIVDRLAHRQTLAQHRADNGHVWGMKGHLSNTRIWHNAGLMLDQRLRRCPSISPALRDGQLFAGMLCSGCKQAQG